MTAPGSNLVWRVLLGLLFAGFVAVGLGVLIFLIEPGLVYRTVSRIVVADDPLESADFIYVLNGRIAPRVARATRIYDEGMAPRILIPHTREMARRPDRPLSHLIAAELVSKGVPESAIEIVPFEGGVVDTRDEARALRLHLEEEPAHRVIVVTMDYHTARARRTLLQELRGVDVKISMAGSTDPGLFTPENWWTTSSGRETYFGELVKQMATIVLGLIPGS